MPMKSESQRAFLHANEPEVAKKFEAETPKGTKLPRRAKRESYERKIHKMDRGM